MSVGRSGQAQDADQARAQQVAPVLPAQRYGGLKIGSVAFGGLVAVALPVLLAGVVGAIAAAASFAVGLTGQQVEKHTWALVLVAAVVLQVVLVVACFAGGYVAGRMARFDGARQGFGVWLLGLLCTVVLAVVGTVLGMQNNILDQAALTAAAPVPTDVLTIATAVAMVVLLVGTAGAAILGGKAGQRYHSRIDQAISSR